MKLYNVCFISGPEENNEVPTEYVHVYAKDALQAVMHIQECSKMGEVIDVRMEYDKILEANKE